MIRKGFLSAVLLMPMLLSGSFRADGMDLVGQDLMYAESGTSNWYAGFEGAILKPHRGKIMAGDPGSGFPLAAITPGHRHEFAPRVWLGWDNAEGIGFQVRYWQIDASAAHVLDFPLEHPLQELDGAEVHTWVEAHTLDVEATLRGCLGRTNFLLAGGFRYAKLDTGLAAFGVSDVQSDLPPSMVFEGGGLTVAAEANRPFGDRGFALVAGLRHSWIYGHTNVQIADVPLTLRFDDHLMQINEARLGVEWSRCLANGNVLTAGAVWEVQAWELAPVAGFFNQDVGFSGPTFSISLMR